MIQHNDVKVRLSPLPILRMGSGTPGEGAIGLGLSGWMRWTGPGPTEYSSGGGEGCRERGRECVSSHRCYRDDAAKGRWASQGLLGKQMGEGL